MFDSQMTLAPNDLERMRAGGDFLHGAQLESGAPDPLPIHCVLQRWVPTPAAVSFWAPAVLRAASPS